MDKAKLHTFGQMVRWARENPDGFPDWHFYDYSEIAFVRRLREEVRLSNRLEKTFPEHFEREGILKRIANAVRDIIRA